MVKKETRVDRIRNIIENDMLSFHNYKYPRYIKSYKDYIGFMGDRLDGLEAWKNNMSFPIIAQMVDTINSSVFDFDYKIELKSDNLSDACRDAFDYEGRGKKALSFANKEAIITGDGIIRDYISVKEESYEILDEDITVEETNPYMEYVSVFNVMYDNVTGLNDSSYTTIRTFNTIDQISNLLSLLDDDNKKKVIAKVKTFKDSENKSFSYYNYESIKNLIFSYKFYSSIKKESSAKGGKLKGSYSTNLKTAKSCNELNPNKCDNKDLVLKDNPYLNNFNEKYEVIMFREKNKQDLFINGHHIATFNVQPNMFVLRGIAFSDIAGGGTSRGVSEILGPIQAASTGMINMFLDGATLGNTKVFSKKSGGTLGNKNARIELKSGEIHSGDLNVLNLGGADFGTINGIQVLQQFAQSLLGINQMIIGGDSRVQRVAGAFEFAFKQYKTRLTPFTDTINIAMGKVVKGWVLQYLHFFTADELLKDYKINVEIEREGDDNKGKVKNIKIDGIDFKDIINENNISFNYDSMYNLTKEAEKKTMMDIYQTAKQYNSDKVDDKKFVQALSGDKTVDYKDALGVNQKGLDIDEGLTINDNKNEIENFIQENINIGEDEIIENETDNEINNLINKELL